MRVDGSNSLIAIRIPGTYVTTYVRGCPTGEGLFRGLGCDAEPL